MWTVLFSIGYPDHEYGNHFLAEFPDAASAHAFAPACLNRWLAHARAEWGFTGPDTEPVVPNADGLYVWYNFYHVEVRERKPCTKPRMLLTNNGDTRSPMQLSELCGFEVRD